MNEITQAEIIKTQNVMEDIVNHCSDADAMPSLAKWHLEQVREMQSKLNALEREKLKLEARCAVLHCGIENISNLCSREAGDAMVSTAFIHEMCKQALSPTAGQFLLEKVGRYEKALREISDDPRKPIPEIAICEYHEIAQRALEGGKE